MVADESFLVEPKHMSLCQGLNASILKDLKAENIPATGTGAHLPLEPVAPSCAEYFARFSAVSNPHLYRGSFQKENPMVDEKRDNKQPIGDDIDKNMVSPHRPQPVSRDIGAQPAALKFIAKHTVQAGDTLGSIALKYYKNAGEKYYMPIYEANKSVIGDNPNKIRLGMA
jgi:hypothetical protein